jgi:hypothetical protein
MKMAGIPNLLRLSFKVGLIRHVVQAAGTDVQPLATVFAERLRALVIHSSYQG